MAQRLVRAKRKIRDGGIPYRVPRRRDPARPAQRRATGDLPDLQRGLRAERGPDVARARDLCAEAIRLAQLLAELMPDEPEAFGLLALMLLQDSRRDARLSPDGELVLLADQDRDLWDAREIDEGLRMLARAEAFRRPGLYQLQAAIAAGHAQGSTRQRGSSVRGPAAARRQPGGAPQSRGGRRARRRRRGGAPDRRHRRARRVPALPLGQGRSPPAPRPLRGGGDAYRRALEAHRRRAGEAVPRGTPGRDRRRTRQNDAMRISAKVDYALRATIELAAVAPGADQGGAAGDRAGDPAQVPREHPRRPPQRRPRREPAGRRRRLPARAASRRDHRRRRDPRRRRADRERPRRASRRDHVRRSGRAAPGRLDRAADGHARRARGRPPSPISSSAAGIVARRRRGLSSEGERRVPGRAVDVDDLPGRELVQLRALVAGRLHREALAVGADEIEAHVEPEVHDAVDHHLARRAVRLHGDLEVVRPYPRLSSISV